MKICHLTSAHNPEDVRIFSKECVSLANNGNEVFLVEVGDSYVKNGVNIVGVGEPETSRIKRMIFTSFSTFKSALKLDAEIYHLHDPELLIYALIFKLLGKKVIFDSHEYYYEQIKTKDYLNPFSKRILSELYYRFESFVCKRIDAVIIPTTINGNNFFENRSKRTEIISNAPRLEEFERVERDGYCGDKICYIGSLTEDRGIIEIIKAAYNAHVEIKLIGSYKPLSFKDRVESLPEYSVVDYLGYVPHERIPELINDCSIGMCVLKDSGQYLKIDTFGIKVFEYMAMGIPVILSHSSFNDEIIKKHQIGMCVNPNDIKDITNAIQIMLNDKAQLAKMGDAGKKCVLNIFNWTTEEKKLIELYESIV